MSDEARLADLESRLSFQDDTLQTLNDMVYAQQQLIDRLQLQVRELARRQQELQGQLGGGEDDEVPPPHY